MDLTTEYMGLQLRSPLVPSAAQPLTEEIDNVKKMEDVGAGAVVLHSLFEEQLVAEKFELNHHLEYATESFAESLTYFPEPEEFKVSGEEYLEHIRFCKESVDIPVIASLNGYTKGGWVEYAQLIEQAGADAIELNVYYVPTDLNITGEQVERQCIEVVREVKSEVKIPLAIKLSPFYSNFANFAKQLDEAGADALVLFNRFYQPDIDLEELEVRPHILLSTPQAMRLPMRWIAILYKHISADMAATSGIQKGQDAIKMLMVGAKITQLCSVLLRHGIGHIKVLEKEMKHWMEEHEYTSIKQMQGTMSQIHCPDRSAFERAQYLRGVQSYKREMVVNP